MEETNRIEVLKKWRNQIKTDIECLQTEVSNSQKALAQYRDRLDLINKLLDLEGENNYEGILQREMVSIDLLDECENILLETGGPLHIKDLHSKLFEMGVPIPGKGNEANVITRIQRSNGRIIRTGRGTYSLPEFGHPELKPTKKKKKIKA